MTTVIIIIQKVFHEAFNAKLFYGSRFLFHVLWLKPARRPSDRAGRCGGKKVRKK
jgi:hypothetical protein